MIFTKHHNHPWTIVGVVVAGLAVVGVVVYAQRETIGDILANRQKSELPLAQERDEIAQEVGGTSTSPEGEITEPPPKPSNTNRNANTNSGATNVNAAVEEDQPDSTVEAAALKLQVNLKIPFTPQAPHANWDADHGEFCEEASVLMAARYMAGKKITGADDAEASLQDIKAWEVKTLGYHKDTTAVETARILKEKFNLKKSIVVKNPSISRIKKELSAGNPVIVPAAGRLLGNPYYRRPGPLYHMLVIKGYTKDGKFITNDPGTKRGADYVYSPTVIMNAMHDWNDGDVLNGQKVVIVVRG